MRLAEYDGKVLLRRHGFAVPRGVLLHGAPPLEVAQWAGHVLKAQVLEGGRGKRGLVRVLPHFGALDETRGAVLSALNEAAPHVSLLLEEAIAVTREIYVSVRIDGTRQCLELLVAPQGGVEVEEAETLLRLPIDPLAPVTPDALYPELATLFPRDLAARVARYVARLPDIVRAEDLELLEINPLVLTPDGRLIACDAKIIRDDSASFRHDPDDFPISRSLESRSMTPMERAARHARFQLVEIEGDVALVTAGAGLGMMMMDLLADHGLRAACFMDNIRGAPPDTTEERLRIARQIAQRPSIKAIVFQTTLASRSLAERIEALLAWVAAEPLPKPLFVGITAGHAATRRMSTEAAVARLREVGIAAFTDPIALVRATSAAVGAASKPA